MGIELVIQWNLKKEEEIDLRYWQLKQSWHYQGKQQQVAVTQTEIWRNQACRNNV